MVIIRSSKTGDGWDVVAEEGGRHYLLHFAGEPSEAVIVETLDRVIAAEQPPPPEYLITNEDGTVMEL